MQAILRHELEWKSQVVDGTLTRQTCTRFPAALPCTGVVQLGGDACALAFDYYGAFGTDIPARSVSVFTDGSAVLDEDDRSSAWGMCVADDSFDDLHAHVPSDESMIGPWHYARASCLYACGISLHVSQSAYMAELQAVVRALFAFPVTFSVHLYLDCVSAIRAVQAVCGGRVGRRAMLRMSGRPLIAMIARQVRERQDRGGNVTFQHVRSLTGGASRECKGNSLADHAAGRARQACAARERAVAGGRLPAHAGGHALPGIGAGMCAPLRTELGEVWLALSGADGSAFCSDVRRAVREGMSARSLKEWQQSATQSTFACA